MTKKRAKRKTIATKASGGSGGGQSGGSGGGLMMGMRHGFKKVVGQADGPQAKKKRVSTLDVVLWLAVIAMAVYVLARRFG